MKSSMFRSAALLFLIPVCAFSATNVLNLSHYDMMRPDFATMKRQGIVGVIHEATYPPFVRDPKYLDRQMGDGHVKSSHKAHLWGMYVARSHRRQGIGADLVQSALRHARALTALSLVHLAVS